MIVCNNQMADNYQNGCRLTSHSGGHLNDPRLKHCNATNSENIVPICRDFIRGTCDKYYWCKFRHEWDIQDIIKNDILKFCHDYQNNIGQCTKLDCSYVHATSEEEELFKTTGQIPQAVAERHATYDIVPNNAERAFNVGFHNCNVNYAPPPPPPVGASAPPTLSSNMLVAQACSNADLNAPPPAMTMSHVLARLPPPPPPPPPPPSAAPRTTTPLVSLSNLSPNTPPVYPSMFDASRPPPPLPANLRENGKRKLPDPAEAGPSKVKNPDHSKTSGHCDNCVQRQIRIVLYKQEMEKLLAEDEKKSLAYRKKLQTMEKGKQLIRSRFSFDLYQFIEEYLEIPDFFLSNNFVAQSNQNTLTTSKVSKQILLQLMKLMARNISESSLSLEEQLLRAGFLEKPRVPPAADLMQEIAEMLASSERGPAVGAWQGPAAPAIAPAVRPAACPPPPPPRPCSYASYPPSLTTPETRLDMRAPPPPPPPLYSTPPSRAHRFPYQK